MSKWGTDENGWPLVPCDPSAIPEGFEPVRVGAGKPGEVISLGNDWTYSQRHAGPDAIVPRLIVRPIPKPITLPLAIVPHGWWVAKDCGEAVFVYSEKPSSKLGAWSACGGKIYRLPPWIAANLPAEWHDMPWDQSAMQQTEGDKDDED